MRTLPERLLLLSLLGTPACGASRHMPAPDSRHGERRELMLPMPDGVPLYTRVHLPRGEGPFPTLLMRVPYDIGPVLDQRCRRYTRHGYACVWQFVRGRGKSGGRWLPFEHEPADGAATLEWLVAQPWQDGHIGLLGESYLGAVQWAVADRLPPEVRTLVPSVIGTDMYAALYEHGALRHEVATAWMSLMPEQDFRFLRGARGYHRALQTRPRTRMDVAATERELPWFDAWLHASRATDPLWQREVVHQAAAAPAQLDLPVLMLGGWADAFLGPQLHTWSELGSRAQSSLVIGPWDHLGRVAADRRQPGVGDELGLDRRGSQQARVLDWLDHHLKGEPLRHPPGVLVYAINQGWERHRSWPPPTREQRWYLQPGEQPQRCAGGLGPEPASGQLAYVYDPADPTPALGGAGLLAGVLPGWGGVQPGVRDQGRLCERRDDLVGFRSEPLAEALHISGEIRAELAVASSAPDSAFNLRVLEERADGSRLHIREAQIFLSHRQGDNTEISYRPGSTVQLPLRTWPVDYVIPAGSRLLVQVASASFPKYEAHPNLAGPIYEVAHSVPAQQTISLEQSWVQLPLRLS